MPADVPKKVQLQSPNPEGRSQAKTAAPLPGKQKLNALESGIAVDTYCETGDAFFLTIELPDRHPS
jgi:hypothetical protein